MNEMERERSDSAILHYGELESLLETFNILSDGDTMAALEESEADIREGRLADIDFSGND